MQREWLLRKFKTGISLCTGKFGCTPLPLATKLTHVYGRPIACLGGQKTQNPTEEQLAATFTAYKAEVLRLFDKHSANLLPPEVAKNGLKVIRRGVDFDDRDASSRRAASRAGLSSACVETAGVTKKEI